MDIVFNTGMTRANTDTIACGTSRPWTEPLLLAGAGLTLLAIVAYEASKWFYGDGIGFRVAGILLAVVAGIVLAIWAARRPEKRTRRGGAFALTWGILGLLTAGAAYLIEQAVQHAIRLAVFGPLWPPHHDPGRIRRDLSGGRGDQADQCLIERTAPVYAPIVKRGVPATCFAKDDGCQNP